jgi:multidrug transporter EmrE-like cation transporter
VNAWLSLAVAILAEVVATSTLPATQSFTRWLPSAVVAIGYGLAFYFLAQCLKAIPVGVAYAVWSGAGLVLITCIGWLVYRQALDGAAFLGMGLILAGVVVLRLFSKASVA